MKWKRELPRKEGWYFWRWSDDAAIWSLHVYKNKKDQWMAEWIEDHKRDKCPIEDLGGSYWKAHRP